MNKTQLIDAIASGANMTKTTTNKVLGSMTGAIKNALKNGERVSIPGFGTFHVVERKARKGRNPRTGEAIRISAKNVVKFRASKHIFAPPIDPALLVK